MRIMLIAIEKIEIIFHLTSFFFNETPKMYYFASFND